MNLATLQKIDPRIKSQQACDAIALACKEFGITDLDEQAAFIAQCTFESGGFNALSENLNYTTTKQLMAVFPSKIPDEATAQKYVKNPEGLADLVYSGKNGNVAPGDGWLYRGRGYIQLTGKANYLPCLNALYGKPDADPNMLATPEGAARSAAWFWKRNGCVLALKSKGIDAVTRIINGPHMLGAKERAAFYEKAKEVLK